MRNITKLILPLLVILSLQAYVHASARVALVIGNGDYQSAPLKNPVNDAADMAATLADLGFDVITEKDASKRDMIDAINRFARKLNRAEIGLFYYAGHGMQINDRNYLIPVKVSVQAESDVEFEAVDAARILGRMRHAGTKLNVVILDACRNNPFARSFRTSTQGLARMDAPIGTIVAYATSPGSIAADGSGRNGMYTKHLLTSLKKPNLDIQDIFNEAGRGVMSETGNRQIPWTSNTPLPRYYLTGGEPSSAVSDGGSDIAAGETGSLRVSSIPSGAAVTINGTGVGTTPLLLERIHTGFMEVRISKDGYKPGVREVLVKAGERFAVNVDLERVRTTGTLTVQVTPADARVRILNIKPTYRAGMELPPGRYHVEVSAEGYVKWERWIELAAGDSKQPSIILEKSAVPETTTLSEAHTGRSYVDPTTGMEFVFVKGGCYQMGDTFGNGSRDEKPVHKVCVDDFYIGTYEVTQGQYKKIIGRNPSRFSRDDLSPVENVSWHDTQSYITQLNNESGKRFRLPTEAEWEYAARSGGKPEKYAGGAYPDTLAWYNHNSRFSTHPVGRKQSNGLGIYDMSGNVWEWCSDWYNAAYYRESAQNNPAGPLSGTDRVFRGGGWNTTAHFARSTVRVGYTPDYRDNDLGFRLVFSAHSGPTTELSTTRHDTNNKAVDSIPGERFFQSGRGTVSDNHTGLMWLAQDSYKRLTWPEAQSYCKQLEVGGHTDWHLPTKKQLIELHNSGIRPRSLPGNHSIDINGKVHYSNSLSFEVFDFTTPFWNMQSRMDSKGMALCVRDST